MVIRKNFNEYNEAEENLLSNDLKEDISMSDKEKRNAIPAEGTVSNVKPEVKEGFFQKIGRKAKEFAAKPAVRKVAKISCNVLMAAGLVGLGWAAHEIADENEDNESPDEAIVLTEGDYEQQSSEEETEAENE